MHTKFLLENLKGRDDAEGVSLDGRLMLHLILREIRWEDVD